MDWSSQCKRANEGDVLHYWQWLSGGGELNYGMPPPYDERLPSTLRGPEDDSFLRGPKPAPIEGRANRSRERQYRFRFCRHYKSPRTRRAPCPRSGDASDRSKPSADNFSLSE